MGLLDTIKEALTGKGVTSGMQSPKGTAGMDEALSKYATDLNLQNLLVLGAEFKPDDILDLRRRARYGDPRWLYALYDEMNRLGPAPQISKMRMALKNTDSIWKATPDDYDDDEATEPEAKAARLIRDVCEEAWGKWLPAIKSHHSTKHLYGIQAMQIVVEPRGVADRWERVVDVRPLPARRFRLDPMTRKFLFLPQPTSWNGYPIEDLIQKGQMFWAEVGKDVEPLDQRGLLFQCLIPWAIHQYIVRWRAKRMEIYGLPPRIVSYKSGSPDGKRIAEEVAQMLGTASWAAVPDGMKAELLQIPTGRGIDPYESAIEWAVRTYDQLILGHSQASGVQVGAGSRTSTEAASEMAKDLINARSSEFDDDFSTGPLFLYVKRNFGEQWAQTSTPMLTSRMVERDDATMLSTVAMNLQKAGCAGIIDGIDVVERCGFEVAGDGDVTLAGNVKGEEPPPGMGMPGLPGQAPPGAPGTALPPSEGEPGQQAGPGQKALPVAGGGGGAAASGEKQPAQKPGTAAPGKPAPKANAKMGVPMGVTGQPTAYTLRKKKRRRDFRALVSRRQRFAVAVSQTRPRVHITTFGYDVGVPDDMDTLIDVRSLAPVQGSVTPERTGLDAEVAKSIDDHPRTGVVMGGVKSAALRAISAAQLTGEPECKIGIGCAHGRHRSVYAAEKLKADLIADGHDVTVHHRDATDPEMLHQRLPGPGVLQPSFGGMSAEGGEQFYSDSQPRDDNGRWSGGAAAAEKAQTPAEHIAAAAYHHERAAGLMGQAVEHGKAGDSYAKMVTEVAAAGHVTAATQHERAAKVDNALASKVANDHSRDAHFAHYRILGPDSMYRKYSPGANEKLGVAERFYSEDQPRGPDGRWGDTGGTRNAGVEWKQPVDSGGRPIPIKVKTVEEAIPLVLAGKVVEMPDVKSVSTLIDKLGAMAQEAKTLGKAAPNYDLCKVSVSGTNLFCGQSLRTKEYPEGIPRLQMPQLAGEPVPGTAAALLTPNFAGSTEVDGGQHFISYMAGLGYPVTSETVLAADLKASQSELVGQKVAGIMKAAETNRGIIDSPIFISRDNYIVDGHHRWAAVVGLDTGRGKFDTRMNVHRVDAPISEVLRLATVWGNRFGIAQASGAVKHSARRGVMFTTITDAPRPVSPAHVMHKHSAAHHYEQAAASHAIGDHKTAVLHEKAAAAHEIAAQHADGPEATRATELAQAASMLTVEPPMMSTLLTGRELQAEAVPPSTAGSFATTPVKGPAFAKAQAQIAARVRTRLKQQHEIATKMVEEKVKSKPAPPAPTEGAS